MKNVQLIDGARNCSYNIYALEDEEFDVMFPDGADIEFIEHFWRRVGVEKANRIMKSMNSRLLDKSKVNGIHGTLFIQLVKQKKHLYPNKRFSDDPATKH